MQFQVGDKVSPRYNNDIGTVTDVLDNGETVVVEYPWGQATHADIALVRLS